MIIPQRFYSRDERGSLEHLEESFRKGHFFVERKSDHKWLVPMVHHSTVHQEDKWTSDPLQAMDWDTKPQAELEIIRCKISDIAIVTEHEFINP